MLITDFVLLFSFREVAAVNLVSGAVQKVFYIISVSPVVNEVKGGGRVFMNPPGL